MQQAAHTRSRLRGFTSNRQLRPAQQFECWCIDTELCVKGKLPNNRSQHLCVRYAQLEGRSAAARGRAAGGTGVLLCFVYTLTLKARLSEPRASAQTGDVPRAEGGGDDVVEVDVREVVASNETEEEVVLPEWASAPSVGSAVFNILFVISMCVPFLPEMLHLTWWPLFERDLLHPGPYLLIIFFLDNMILWWESIMCWCWATSHVSFMRVQQSRSSRWSKTQLNNKHMWYRQGVWTAEEPGRSVGVTFRHRPRKK
ncbi:sodium/potassium/calcium exchanger 1-like isoform X1 [Lates japonicus]|uniref:Sodium/potassium/calcium exchanger 1 n=1 Tax=Lates japonicus TaxID=270547 RepID=A0AAD3RN58_LATJO|nr:sodium/potassium/calcium exchanger 1-like isoform X1 [Lates japonicus]